MVIFALLIAALDIGKARSIDVCLFASCGCHSHNVMMKNVGEDLEDANISWVQSSVFEFGFGLFQLPKHWNQIRSNDFDSNVEAFMRQGSMLNWIVNVPIEFSRPWDLRGFFTFVNILKQSQFVCQKMVRSSAFSSLQQRPPFDLVIVDHIVQACTTVMASLLNATTVQYSNWPVSDGYLASFNVPSNPSYVARTLTPFSTRSMTFWERLYNTNFDLCIILMRTVEAYITSMLYSKIGIENVNVFDIEAKQIIYGARSGLLFEPIRPLSNRIKHFGCPSCRSLEEYQIASPKKTVQFSCLDNEHLEALQRVKNISTDRLLPHFLRNCKEVYQETDEQVVRFLSLQSQFPSIDFYRLERQKFVLVSFGSLAKVQDMPAELLEMLLSTFGQLDRLVIWQTNSDTNKYLKKQTVPPNVVMCPWVPLKHLLAHRNLLYVITHGGINTVNELLFFGVPIIGVPLQGDQLSNMQSLVDLGMGTSEKIINLWKGGLALQIQHMEANLQRYTNRARKLGRMAQDQHQHYLNSQRFWLQWTARHGEALRKDRRKYFDFFYRRFSDYFALPQLASASVIIAILLCAVY